MNDKEKEAIRARQQMDWGRLFLMAHGELTYRGKDPETDLPKPLSDYSSMELIKLLEGFFDGR